MLANKISKKARQSGYALLSVMLIIGGISVYFAYQASIKKIQDQSWQVQKAAAEISYWFDIEQNYRTDNPMVNIQNLMLVNTQQAYYLPYGSSTISTFGGNSLSEFSCSPLAGITQQDQSLRLSGNNSTAPVCTGSVCTLNPAYYSCGTSGLAKAQYYINTNYVSLNYDTTKQSTPVGIGLIVRTPGVNLQAAQLPNNSTAHSLLPLLPTSSFNLYATPIAQTSGVGIASYATIAPIGTPTIQANTLYSKIIDMGLVQASSMQNEGKGLECSGVNSSGTKTGTGINGSTKSKKNYPLEPPTCISIDTSKTADCSSVDILYTPSYFYHGGANGLPGIDTSSIVVRPSTSGDSNKSSSTNAVFLSIFGVYYSFTPWSGDHFLVSDTNYQRDYLIYLVRCTKHP